MSDEQKTSPQAAQVAEVPKGYWRSANGDLVPVAKIKPIERDRQALVTGLAEAAKGVNSLLAEFRGDVMAQIAKFVARSAAEYGVEMGGTKGNVTLVSFDGRYKIVRQVSETLAFDERLQVAKEIIDQCVHLWAKGANKNIQALVNHAFQVDKTGKVSTGRVLGLRQLKIDDENWKRAMDAIADSMRATASKSYVRFYERDGNGDYQPISLDAASV